MLISHRHKFIFTKTVKTAGTSVEIFFEPFCAPDSHTVKRVTRNIETKYGIIGARGNSAAVKSSRWYNHMPASLIKTQIGEEVWNEYFKFTTIRNPFDKLVSWFYFRHLPKNATGIMSFDEIKREFRKYILTSDYLPALDRDKYTIGQKICVDRFIRYELLDLQVKEVASHLGIDVADRDLPHLKARFRQRGYSYRDYYDEETSAVVVQAFGFELREFSYEF